MGQEAAQRRIRWAAALVAAQALVLAVLAAIEIASLDRAHPSVALTTATFYVIFGVGIAAAAWGLDRHRGWSRAPVVLVEFISLGVGWSFRGGSTTWVCVALIGCGLVVLAIVLSPSTTAALFGDRGGESES